MILAASLAMGGCLVLGAAADRITAADMALAVPEFAALDPSTPLAFAPLAGARRVFSEGELLRLAQRAGIALPAAREVCAERDMRAPDPGALLA
jgi:hypothetical protein